VINVENSFDGQINQRSDGTLVSEKGVGHGIGLSSVKSLAGKYQGHCAISIDQQLFSVAISLKLPKPVAA